MTITNNKAILQILPSLETGGTERVVISAAIAVKEAGYKSFVVSNGGRLVRELERAGVIHIEMPVHAKNIFTIKSRVAKLRKVIADNNISLIHAHSRMPSWIAYKACAASNIFCMNTCHGFFNLKTKLKRRYSKVVSQGARSIAVSKFINQHLCDLGAVPSHIRNIPLGVKLDLYNSENVSAHRMIKLLEEWHIPEETTIVMLPGRVSRTKGHDVLIKAIALGRKDVRYLMVGNYENRPRVKKMLEKLIAEYDVAEQVQFTGNCRDMPAAYRICDLVVVPSTWPEPGGTVAIEAQAMGKPVIVSDAGGMAESVVHGETGYICEAGNHQQLADYIERVLNSSEKEREVMSQAAMARVKKHFTHELMCQRYLDVYAELLANAPANPDILGYPHLINKVG